MTVDTRSACVHVYQIALATPFTGDNTKWPDIIAYQYPLEDIRALVRHLGIVDDDLLDAVVGAAHFLAWDAESTTAFGNVLCAAIAEQTLRGTIRVPTVMTLEVAGSSPAECTRSVVPVC